MKNNLPESQYVYKNTFVPCICRKNVSRVNNVSIVRIFHPYVTTMLYTTNVLYTWQELIAYYGGVLGLCVGFSIVGFMEVVYFSTYRLACNFFRPPKQSIRQPGNTGDGLPSYKEVEQMLLANRQRATEVDGSSARRAFQ